MYMVFKVNICAKYVEKHFIENPELKIENRKRRGSQKDRKRIANV